LRGLVGWSEGVGGGVGSGVGGRGEKVSLDVSLMTSHKPKRGMRETTTQVVGAASVRGAYRAWLEGVHHGAHYTSVSKRLIQIGY
jgi:hypothetical protein